MKAGTPEAGKVASLVQTTPRASGFVALVSVTLCADSAVAFPAKFTASSAEAVAELLRSPSLVGAPSIWAETKAIAAPAVDGTAQDSLLQPNAESSPTEWLFCTHKGKGRSQKKPLFQWTGKLRPDRISPYRPVPAHIARPDYATTGWPAEEVESRKQNSVHIHSAAEIEGIRAACALGRRILDAVAAAIAPGVTTDELDRIAHEVTIAGGGYPSPLNYCSFPKSCCTSVNEVICHGIPDARPLEDGDIVNIDISVYLGGYHGDLNETLLVGSVDEAGKALVRGSWECLAAAIAMCKPGVRFRDIGDVITAKASRGNLSVVRTYCGHGIGELFHCAPNIPHYANNKAAGTMKPGMVFTIEPMINLGSWKDVTWPDGWTSVTVDGKRSAQFEHTLLITDTGVEVLTARKEDSPKLFPFFDE